VIRDKLPRELVVDNRGVLLFARRRSRKERLEKLSCNILVFRDEASLATGLLDQWNSGERASRLRAQVLGCFLYTVAIAPELGAGGICLHLVLVADYGECGLKEVQGPDIGDDLVGRGGCVVCRVV
jgi:hypothetical protein